MLPDRGRQGRDPERYALVSSGSRGAALSKRWAGLRQPLDVKCATSSGCVAQVAFADGGRNWLRHHEEVAYAVWDGQAETLYAQRDCFGVAPFYYCESGGVLYFSNNMLLLQAGVPERLTWNHRCILARIQAIPLPAQETSYDGILTVPPGSTLSWSSRAGVCIERYYDLAQQTVKVSSDFYDNSGRLYEILSSAVENTLDNTDRVAVELSGGLDSSAVSGILARLCPSRLESFSAVFPSYPDCDESDYIAAAVAHQGLKNVMFDAADLDLIGSFEQSVREFGDIHYGANVHIALYIQQLAANAGCSRIFNGIDGDNVASHGLFRLRELASAGDWISFCKETRGISDLFSTHFSNPRIKLFAGYGRVPFQRAADRPAPIEAILAAFYLKIFLDIPLGRSLRYIHSRRKQREPGDSQRQAQRGRFMQSELNQELVRDINFSDYVGALNLPGTEPACERDSQVRLLTGGVNERYFELIQALSARRGIDTFFPFMAREVIEFCLNVPVEHKLRKGWNRAFLRQGFKSVYPEKIYSRRFKSNLAPAAYSLLEKECIADLSLRVQERSEEIWNYFDLGSVKDMLQRVQAKKQIDRGSMAKIWIVWSTARSMEILQNRQKFPRLK